MDHFRGDPASTPASDDFDRELLHDEIVGANAEAARAGERTHSSGDEVIAAALDALARTEESYLEEPLFAWVQECPRKTLLFHQEVEGYPQPEVQFAGMQFLLAYHDATMEVQLIADGENYATLIISSGLDVAIRMVYCPHIVKEAQDLAENY